MRVWESGEISEKVRPPKMAPESVFVPQKGPFRSKSRPSGLFCSLGVVWASVWKGGGVVRVWQPGEIYEKIRPPKNCSRELFRSTKRSLSLKIATVWPFLLPGGGLGVGLGVW